MQLLRKGRSVVAAGRDAERIQASLAELGLEAGRQPSTSAFGNGTSGPVLEIEGGWDVTDAAALGKAERWRGITQVVSALGSKFGRQADGSMGCVWISSQTETEDTQFLKAVLVQDDMQLPCDLQDKTQPESPEHEQQWCHWARPSDGGGHQCAIMDSGSVKA